MKGWLATHPIAGFALLAFGISYALGTPLLIFASGAIPPHSPLLRLYLPRLLVVYGPGIAALTMASVEGPGARALLSKLNPSRSDVAVAAVVIAVGASISAAGLLVAGVAGAEVWQTARGHAGLLFAHFILQLLCIATGEELGWRGWLLPVLAVRTSRIRATLATAAVWALWHGPLLFARPPVVAMFVVSVAGLSVLFTWLWSRAGHRLFPVIVAHAMVNAPMFFWEQAGAAGADRLASAWMAIEAVCASIGVVLVLLGWRWWTSSEPAPALHSSRSASVG
jgi:membrane protease YdiL (CAAX protease family)